MTHTCRHRGRWPETEGAPPCHACALEAVVRNMDMGCPVPAPQDVKAEPSRGAWPDELPQDRNDLSAEIEEAAREESPYYGPHDFYEDDE